MGGHPCPLGHSGVWSWAPLTAGAQCPHPRRTLPRPTPRGENTRDVPSQGSTGPGTCDILPWGPCAAPSQCPPVPVAGPCSKATWAHPHQVGLHLRQHGPLLAARNFLLVPKTTSWSIKTTSCSSKTISQTPKTTSWPPKIISWLSKTISQTCETFSWPPKIIS